MPLLGRQLIQATHSWPPFHRKAGHRCPVLVVEVSPDGVHAAAEIDNDPFAHFLTPTPNSYDEDVDDDYFGDWSAGIAPKEKARPRSLSPFHRRSCSPTPSPPEANTPELTPSPPPSRESKPSPTYSPMLTLRRWVKLSSTRPHRSTDQMARSPDPPPAPRLLAVPLPLSDVPELLGIPSREESGRGRSLTRGTNRRGRRAGRPNRGRVWRLPSQELWTVTEEGEHDIPDIRSV